MTKNIEKTDCIAFIVVYKRKPRAQMNVFCVVNLEQPVLSTSLTISISPHPLFTELNQKW